MFVDAKEVENNLQVCGKLHDQIIDKDFNVQEMEEVYEQQGSTLIFYSCQNANMSSSNLSLTPKITINELDVSTMSDVKDASTSQLHKQNDFIYAPKNYFGSEYKSYFIMNFLTDFHKDDHAYQQEDKFAVNKDNLFSNQATAPHCLTVKNEVEDVNVDQTHEDTVHQISYLTMHDVHALFPVEQIKYHLISEAEKQCDLLYQLEMQHNWQDPMAIYMELRFLKNFILAEFGIKEDYDCKYALQNAFLLQMLNSSLIYSYMP